jgi:type III restriction enzyme
MSVQIKIDDFVLSVQDQTEKTLSTVHKYDAFLDALTTDDFAHIREATRQTIRYFVTPVATTTEQAAIQNYEKSLRLKTHHETQEAYLQHFRIKGRRSYSIDLATGTGKSWVIYAVAQIMLSEGLVDKVLVLCPSLTIEEGLKKKFEHFSGDQILTKILLELGALYSSPSIKNANVPILSGDICIENIHAAYERTGSSIEDSFKGKGQRTLVISDEAHHIYSDADADTKKWYDFLINPEYGFYYLLGMTGTPYVENEYFHDVIYRYSLRQAMDDGVVKKIDYKKEEEYQKDKGFSETYTNHLKNQEQYGHKLKPISIIVTDKIVTCVEVWDGLVKFIAKKEKLSYSEAAKKAIWVTSGIPSNRNEKEKIESIITGPDKIRKKNLEALKTVDDPESPVEWVVSVSMLTEGWDVKNVFQIVPHEQRAFNSKLLISQVLGRGLRIPNDLEHPIYVKINNHERWTEQIENLYKEILEFENRISWKYDPNRKESCFPLYNLKYDSVQQTIEIKTRPAKAPEVVNLSPQSQTLKTSSTYSATGTMKFTVEKQDNISIDRAVREIKLFLKNKDEHISDKWSKVKIKNFVIKNLNRAGQETTYISFENLSKIKQAFGPMFRDTGKPTPRLSMKADALFEVSIEQMSGQSFSEDAMKNNGYVFYDSKSIESLHSEEKEIFSSHLDKRGNYKQLEKTLESLGHSTDEIRYLMKNLWPISDQEYKTPLNLVYVSYRPEYRFTKSVFANHNLIDSFVKSPDRGFYSFPYSYKPTETGSTHVRQEYFNPDFFLKLKGKNDILVVEMKQEGDIASRNKAKLRDGSAHFEALNEKLREEGISSTYHFYFLSPDDITEFFEAVRADRYAGWKSSLMQELRNG